MKTLRILVVVIAVSSSPVLLGQQSESADQQLKAAMHRELVGGDLRAAIKEYDAIVSRNRDSRPVVARALLQIALCHEKLGDGEARMAFERVVRDYADQTEPAAQARARLTALSTTTNAGDVRPLDGLGPRALQSMSPDGARAVVIDYERGPNLAVYDFATHKATRLTNFEKATSEVGSGVWSRDGRRIAFAQGDYKDSIYQVRVATPTGETRTIFRNEANAGKYVAPVDWLADGRTILATLQRADNTWTIGLIPAEGGPFTPLRSLQWTGGPPDRPRVSPDGRFIAFADGTAGARDIHLLTTDGRTASQLTNHPADDGNPIWSGNGKQIAFISARNGNAALWVVDVNGGKPGEPIRVKESLNGVSLIDWTPRGVVYTRSVRTSDIYTVATDAATQQPSGAPQQLPYARTGRNAGPAWAPDGRHLAFVSGTPSDPNRRLLVVLPANTGDPREFLIPTTRYAADPYDLRWFGDGSGVGFSGLDAQGQATLFRLSLSSGEWNTTPAPTERVLRIEWNQTGNRILYVRGLDLVERDLESGQERVIADRQAIFAEAARAKTGGTSQAITAFRGLRVSPDRRSLVLTSSTLDGDHMAGLWVVNLQSGAPRLLHWERSAASGTTIVTFGSPTWSHDGRQLLLPRLTGATRWPDLRLVSVETEKFRPLELDRSFVRAALDPADVGTLIDGLALSPDGTRLAFVLTANRRTEAWILEPAVAVAGALKRQAP